VLAHGLSLAVYGRRHMHECVLTLHCPPSTPQSCTILPRAGVPTTQTTIHTFPSPLPRKSVTHARWPSSPPIRGHRARSRPERYTRSHGTVRSPYRREFPRKHKSSIYYPRRPDGVHYCTTNAPPIPSHCPVAHGHVPDTRRRVPPSTRPGCR